MATKSKTTTKPRTTKTIKGTSGLKKNSMNWKFIIVLLVLVTAVGGYFAYRAKILAVGETIAQTNYSVTSANVTRNGGSVVSNTWVGGPGNWIKFRAGVTSANYGAKEYCAVAVAGSKPGGGVGISASTAWGGSEVGGPEITNTGGSNYRICVILNGKSKVGDWVELYVCGHSKETRKDVNNCTTGQVDGNVTVQYFYRPSFVVTNPPS